MCDGLCNVISGNSTYGVALDGNGTISNTVQGNYIGVGPSVKPAIPNGQAGIIVTDSAALNNIGDDRSSSAAALARPAAASPPSRTLARQTPDVVTQRRAVPRGHHDPRAVLTLDVGLAVRDSAALDALIAAVSNPSSPQYGHYLTNAQYLACFAPTVQQVQAVRAWASGAGLTVRAVSPDNLLVTVSGTTRQVERALGVAIDEYRLGSRSFMSNDRDPTVPAGLDIRAISGLSTIHRFHTMLARTYGRATSRASNRASSHTPLQRAGGYFPNDFRAAYNMGPVGDGSGQTIGLTLWGAPVAQGDLNAFATNSGTTALVSGQAGDNGIDWIPVNGGSSDTHDIVETALDVEYAHGVAPNSHLKYWLSDCAFDALSGHCNASTTGLELAISAAANDTSVHVVSNSWGGDEAASAADPFVSNVNASLQHADVVGTTFYFASGDTALNSGGAGLPSFPADSPYVVAVGGTSLTTASSYAYGAESAWTLSGCGCSAVFARPTWQIGVGAATCSGRAEPDVAADADPNTGANVFVQGVSQLVGGTSLAAPLWAGMAADVNRYLGANGQPLMGFATPRLYLMAANPPTYSRDFHDVTSGTNGYPTGSGWDEATGWGSPNLANLALDWTLPITPPNTPTNTSTPLPTATPTQTPIVTGTPTPTGTPQPQPTLVPTSTACAGPCNVISGNSGNGVVISGYGTGYNTVQGNYIGVDPTGRNAVPNGGSGVAVTTGAAQNTIGGAHAPATCDRSCNVISGNGINGVVISGFGTNNNNVQGDFIGLDAAGANPVPNAADGVAVSGGAIQTNVGLSDELIERPRPLCDGNCNVIGGNGANGVSFTDIGTISDTVQGDFIGVTPDGTSTIPNHAAGVLIQGGASGITVGGDPTVGVCARACNAISGNVGPGVSVVSASSRGNTIRGNDIHDNGGLGIDLGGDGVTPNGADGRRGPNNLVNFPVGVSAQVSGTQTIVTGVLSSTTAASDTIDVYATHQPDSVGYANIDEYFGGGEVYLGSTTPSTTGAFMLVVSGTLPVPFVSATTTDQNGNTSEFGPVCGDPNHTGNPMSSGDGLCDDWKKYGIDYNGDGKIDLPLNQAPYNANPAHKDLYVEIDYMQSITQSLKPDAAALQAVVNAFASAPVTNTDGTTGITLHPLVDEPIPLVSPMSWSDFYRLKLGDDGHGHPNPCGTGPNVGYFGTATDRADPNCVNIIGARRLAFRYAIFGQSLAAPYSGASGVSELPGSDLMVTLGDAAFTNSARVASALWGTTFEQEWSDLQAGTFMHELGHTLGLNHGGASTDPTNCKPNYLSVMNYAYQFNDAGQAFGVPGVSNRALVRTNRRLDYSRGALATLDESNLSEGAGVGGPAGAFCTAARAGDAWWVRATTPSTGTATARLTPAASPPMSTTSGPSAAARRAPARC